ncbi:bifunctional adenosylcobinamide kinase/adenosylcobinamide-phosphate guanylyltransferase [Aeromicrobium sp. UC242_57]|uniref:bifunctional adenosylcobinamide kinase/adenosylcobinamide-phosphate guanylyltransferase n=1 Tax=Aeromicrobium sp. UC242_57 TaxID=3374624 RepID=UPI0037C01DE0
MRSGKSHHAEQLPSPTSRRSPTFAAGPTEADDPDPDWADRLAGHRARRPASWRTVESIDLAEAISATDDAVLIDCLGTWLSRLIDQDDLWEAPMDHLSEVIGAATERLVAALEREAPVVLVTNEVGLGVIPSHRSGRLFRDLLGTVNRQVAAGCDDVHLVIAGRVLVLSTR